jgi:glyoxylase I family protein
VGIDHLSFSVENVAQVRDHLIRNNVEVSPIFIDEQTGKEYAFFYNKDGLKHELFSAGE